MYSELKKVENSFNTGSLSIYFRKILALDTMELQYNCINRVKGLYIIPDEQEIGVFYNQYDSVSYSYSEKQLHIHHDKAGLFESEEDSIKDLLANWEDIEIRIATATRQAYESVEYEELETNFPVNSGNDSTEQEKPAEHKDFEEEFTITEEIVEIEQDERKETESSKNRRRSRPTHNHTQASAYYNEQYYQNMQREYERQHLQNTSHTSTAPVTPASTPTYFNIPSGNMPYSQAQPTNPMTEMLQIPNVPYEQPAYHRQTDYYHSSDAVQQPASFQATNNFGMAYESYNPSPGASVRPREESVSVSPLNINFRNYTEEQTAYRTPVFIQTGDTPLERSVNNSNAGYVDRNGNFYEGMSLIPPEKGTILFDSNTQSGVKQPTNHYYGYDENHPLKRDDFFGMSSVDTMLPPTGHVDKTVRFSDGPTIISGMPEPSGQTAVGRTQNDFISTVSGEAKRIAKEDEQIERQVESDSLRKFRKTIEVAKYLEIAGNTVIDASKNLVNDKEGAAYQGHQEFKKYTDIGASTLATLGAKAELSKLKNIAEATELSTITAAKLIGSGVLRIEDFTSEDSLEHILTRLSDVSDVTLSPKEIKGILKYRDEIHVSLTARDTLLKAASENATLFSEKDLDFIKSGDFFNGKNYKQAEALIAKYFSQNPNEALRKIGIINLRDKDLKRLMKSAQELGARPQEEALLKLLKKNKKIRKADIAKKKMRAKKNRTLTSRVVSGSGMRDDVSFEGISNVKKIYKGYKIGYSFAKWIVLRVYGTKLSKKIRSLVKSKYIQVKKILKNTIATSVKKTKSYNVVKKKLAPIKKTTQKAKAKATKAKRNIKKTHSSVKKATRKTLKVIKKPFEVLAAPFKFLFRGINLLGKAKAFIMKWVCIILIIFVIIYFVLICIATGAMAIGSALANSSDTVIYTEIDYLKEMTNHITDLDAVKYNQALALGQGVPKNNHALNGKLIYRYGSPTTAGIPCIWHNETDTGTSNGYTIHYVDSSGRHLAEKTTNAKDILCIMTTIIANQYPSTGDMSMLEAAPWVYDLIAEIHEHMNPIASYKESDLYFCTYGCDSFNYSCCNYADYTAFESSVDSGVKYYSSMNDYKVLGCSPTYCSNLNNCTNRVVDHYECGSHTITTYCSDITTCNNRKRVLTLSGFVIKCGSHEETFYCSDINSCDNKTPIYRCAGHAHCDGHSVTCCYGHRDIDIYLTVISMEDIFISAQNGNVLTYYDYASSTYVTRNIEYTTTNELISDFINNGGWSNNEHVRICENLYSQDWFEIYGFDVYGGAGYHTGNVLEVEDINALLEKMNTDYPGLSQDRILIVSNALQYVGKIPYYWGGKASAAGWDENYFGTVVTPPEGHPDQTLKGLDCSGFVQWIYWNTFDIKPSGSGTSNLVSSLGGTSTTFRDLLPGDVALIKRPGRSGNHIGIYVGKNEAGKAVWVHCNDADNNVSCNDVSYWYYYYNILD